MAEDAANSWAQGSEDGFEQPHRERQRSPWGCFIWGCLIVVLLTIIGVVGAGVAGYYFLKGQIEKYTDVEPMELPIVEVTDEQSAELEQRISLFQERIGMVEDDEEAPAQPAEAAPVDAAPIDAGPVEAGPMELVLTAEDINMLIASNAELKGRIYVEIVDGQLVGDVSMPTDFLPIGGGRFFNASATFDVMMVKGMLIVRLVDAEIKGERLPDEFLDALANENFASDIGSDPDAKQLLDRIESIRIEEDRIILVAKPPEAANTEGDNAPEDNAMTDETEAEQSAPVEPVSP
jgi:hypothetical protein